MGKDEIHEIYYMVINLTSGFLEKADYLSIESLRKVDPTVEELSRIMRTLATILSALAGSSWDDEKMAHNALQCCLVMERLAGVVEAGDHGSLDEVIRELNVLAKVP